MVVTVIRMTRTGVKTAVSSLTRLSFQLNSSGLEILETEGSKGTTHSENSIALGQHDLQRSYFKVFIDEHVQVQGGITFFHQTLAV